LPFWFTVTGCEAVSMFAGCGKTALQVWESYPSVTKAFVGLAFPVLRCYFYFLDYHCITMSAYLQQFPLVMMTLSFSRDLLCYYMLIKCRRVLFTKKQKVSSRYRQLKIHSNSIFSDQCCRAGNLFILNDDLRFSSNAG
jgi:hypothetical protein